MAATASMVIMANTAAMGSKASTLATVRTADTHRTAA